MKSIKKQVIILVTTFVFALTLCGAVAAEDTSTGGDSGGTVNLNNTSNSSLSEIRITGQVRDCVTNEPFSGVNITASHNGGQLAATQTDNQGKYELQFISNLTQFNVTASYNGHKSSMQLVNATSNIVNNSTIMQGTANFKLGKPRVLFILNGANPTFIDAVKECDYLAITVYSAKKIPDTIKVTDYDMIFVDWLSTQSTNSQKIAGWLNEAAANNVHALITIKFGIDLSNQVIIANGTTEYQYIRDYWSNMNNINSKELLKFIGVKFFVLTMEQPKEPVVVKKEAIYHPDAIQLFDGLADYDSWYTYKSGKPTVGIIFHEEDYKKGDFTTIDALIRAFENKGYNVIPYFYQHEGRPNITKYLMRNDKSAVDLIIHYKMFGWATKNTSEEVQADLRKLDVPVLKAFKYFDNYTKWLNGTQGIQASSIGVTIVPSEMDGMFDPIIISTQEIDPKYLPFDVTLYKPIERQINWIVDMSIAWINLRNELNKDKKVAIIYWHGVGKDTGATAGHLDVYGSLSVILQALKDNGYNLGSGELPDKNALVELIRKQGLNVGVWAPNEIAKLVKNNPVILVPESEYINWFNQLNEAKRNEVIKIWGKPPGNIMKYTIDGVNYLVLPVIQYGNVILAPEPARAYNQDMGALYHSGSVPPTHQYLAFYFWLRNDFKADAIIDMGRHGSVAWLPGKSGPGLDRDNCWPAIVSQDIPVIYPFTVEGSEGLLPKRRQGAVMISHLIPSVTVSGLYGNLTILNDKIAEYNLPNIDITTKANLKTTILQMVKDLRINEDLGINLNSINDANFDEFLGKIHKYLDSIQSEFIPYGLHVFGKPPKGDELTNLVQSLLGYGFRDYMKSHNLSDAQVQLMLKRILIEGKSVEEAQIEVLGTSSADLTNYFNKAKNHAVNINNCTNEVTGLLNALNGKYITPGLSEDPISNPNVLPTGTNFYSFDPRKVPTKEATDIGNQLANDLINDYKMKTGKYPTKISFMLWSCHTQQDMGVMEAAIFYLLGVERVTDQNNPNIVTDVRLIPNLGRSRVDVVITTTSLYMSMFRCRLGLIDKAVRMAANSNDNQPNYVKQNSENLYNYLKSKGYSDEIARKLSMCRIFSQEEGDHSNAAQNLLLTSSAWENESQVANTFIGTFGNVFQGVELNSIHLEELFKGNLKGSEAAVFRRAVSENDLFGDSDYFGYFGGLGLTIRNISGNDPLMYVMNVENRNNPRLETLSESLWRDVRSTYVNPKYISKMMENGASGAAKFAEFIRYLKNWKITSPESVNDKMLQEAYDAFFNDKNNLGIKEWMSKTNPYAYQAMSAEFLDLIMKGYWNPNSEVVTNLVDSMTKNVIDNGVACCDCTCGNLAMMEWATQYINPDILAQFRAQVYKATQNPKFAPSSTSPQTPTGQTGSGQASGKQVSAAISNNPSSGDNKQQSESGQSPGDQGQQKAYEVSKSDSSSSSSQTGMPIAAIIGVVLLVCLVGVGYFRTDIMSFLRR